MMTMVAASIIDNQKILCENNNVKFISTIDTSLQPQYDIPIIRITPTNTIINTTTTTDGQSSPHVVYINMSHQSTHIKIQRRYHQPNWIYFLQTYWRYHRNDRLQERWQQQQQQQQKGKRSDPFWDKSFSYVDNNVDDLLQKIFE